MNPFIWTTPDHFPATVTGKPAVIRNHADLDARIAARRARGEPSRKGWRTRRAAHG